MEEVSYTYRPRVGRPPVENKKKTFVYSSTNEFDEKLTSWIKESGYKKNDAVPLLLKSFVERHPVLGLDDDFSRLKWKYEDLCIQYDLDLKTVTNFSELKDAAQDAVDYFDGNEHKNEIASYNFRTQILNKLDSLS